MADSREGNMTSFVEREVQYKALRARLQQGELTHEEFLQEASELMCQDEAGRWWTIHPESGMWHYRWKDEWRPGVPPGHTPGAIREPAPPSLPPRRHDQTLVADAQVREPAGRPGGFPRWIIPVVLAVFLVAVVAIVVFFVVLPALQRDDESEQVLVTEPPPTLPVATFTLEPTLTSLPPTSSVVTVAETPTDTPTPSVTATDTPEPLGADAKELRPEWPEAVLDDFSRLDSGWSRGIGPGVLIDYRGDQLRIELQGAGKVGWSRFEQESFSNGWFEVTITELTSAAGIALHVTEDYYGYVFRIDAAGRYAFGRTLSDAEPPLIDWTVSDYIHTDGTSNHLAVLAQDNQYFLFINGWLVEPKSGIVDEEHPSGLVALWGASGSEREAAASFDNALILRGPDEIPEEDAASETPTLEPSVTWTPTPDSGVTPESPTKTPTTPVPLAPLTFEVSYDAWYPGSGDKWIIRFNIQAEGGDGNYTVTVADRTFDSTVFDFEWGCGFNLTTEIIVRSGDGQRASINQFVSAVQCVPP